MAKNKLELSLKRVAEGDAVVKPKVEPKDKKEEKNFEQRLSFFMKRSEEKQIDVRRNLKNRQGIPRKKR